MTLEEKPVKLVYLWDGRIVQAKRRGGFDLTDQNQARSLVRKEEIYDLRLQLLTRSMLMAVIANRYDEVRDLAKRLDKRYGQLADGAEPVPPYNIKGKH